MAAEAVVLAVAVVAVEEIELLGCRSETRVGAVRDSGPEEVGCCIVRGLSFCHGIGVAVVGELGMTWVT